MHVVKNTIFVFCKYEFYTCRPVVLVIKNDVTNVTLNRKKYQFWYTHAVYNVQSYVKEQWVNQMIYNVNVG